MRNIVVMNEAHALLSEQEKILEVKNTKICLHCHSQPDKEDKTCKNCGCNDVVNESDLIY